jgi:hypothetical protein
MPYFRLIGVFCFGCLLALSCSTPPRPAEKDERIEHELPPGAAIYGFAGIQYMETFIETVMPEQLNNKQTAEFIKKTDFAVFGLYGGGQNGTKSAGQSVFLIAKGNYPASSYNFGLALSSKWKSAVINGKKWWRQGAIALSVEKNKAYIQLGNMPVSSASPPETPHDDFSTLCDNARHSLNAGSDAPPTVFAAFVSFAETSGLIRSLGIPLDIMLENITLAVTTDAAVSYRSMLRLKTKSPSEAKALSAILSLVRTRIVRPVNPTAGAAFLTDLLIGNPPVLDGNIIAVTGAFPADALIPLLSYFSPFALPQSP